MKLSDKIRYLREVEGNLRALGRAMTQQELVRAIQADAPVKAGAKPASDQPVLSLADSERQRGLTLQTQRACCWRSLQGPPYLSGR